MRQQQVKPVGTTVYEDFSLGDYGVTHPRHGKVGQFHAKNMVVYRDGTIGPRNGLVLQPLSGSNYVNGALNAFFFGVEHEAGVPRMVYAQGTRPKWFEVDDMTSQNPSLFATLTDVTTAPTSGYFGVLPRLGFNMFLASLGDKTYMIDALTDVMSVVNADQGAHDVVEYLDQVYLIGIGSAADGTGHKILYSDHADPTDWPVENEFLVGYAWVVFRGLKLLNGLLIIAQDSSWWLLQGSPEEGSLRRVAFGRAPAIGNPRSVVADRERAWFLASGAPGGSFPATFDGSELDTTSMAHLRGWMTDLNATAVLCEADDDLMFVDNDARALMRHQGIWTRHQYEVAVGEWAAPYEDQRFYLAVNGDVTHKPAFYRSTFAIERPPIKDSLFESPGDGSDTPVDAWIEFPEVWQESAGQARPTTVTLEFTSYDQNVATDAHVKCQVDVIDRFGLESTETVEGGTWDESDATVASTSAGVRRRHIFRLPVAHFGSALQLRFLDVRGIKIEKAVLDYELAEQLDRA